MQPCLSSKETLCTCLPPEQHNCHLGCCQSHLLPFFRAHTLTLSQCLVYFLHHTQWKLALFCLFACFKEQMECFYLVSSLPCYTISSLVLECINLVTIGFTAFIQGLV